MSLARYLTILAVLVLAVVLGINVVKAYEYSFKTNVKVVTNLESFSATDTVDVYLISYPKAVITVEASNPGSSDAGIKVSVDCLNAPSKEATVPAGGSTTIDLELTIPSPPTTYIACRVSANVSNITGIKLAMYYDTDVSLSYNETHAVYTLDLFTEPYYALGGTNKYFDYFLTYPVYGSPASGYSILTNLNTTLSTEYTDSAVSENSKSIGTDGILLNITDTMPAVGRYLGSVTLTLTLPETVNIVVMPKYNEFVGSEDTVHANISTIEVVEDETYEIALINKSKIFDTAGNSYYINYTLIRVDTLDADGFSTVSLSSKEVSGYNVTVFAEGHGKNNTSIKVLALIKPLGPDNAWYEPAKQYVNVVTRYFIINVTLPTLDLMHSVSYDVLNKIEASVTDHIYAKVKPVDIAQADTLYGLKDSVGEGIIIRMLIDGKAIADYVLEAYYVATVDVGNVRSEFTNITSNHLIAGLKDINVNVVNGVPVINASLIAFGNTYGHISLLVPYNVTVSVSKIANIESTVKLTIYDVTVDNMYAYVMIDIKPNNVVRDVKIPEDISREYIIDKKFIKLVIPFTYNDTSFTIDVNALIKVKVVWLDGEPAKGVTVELIKAGTVYSTTITDADGFATFDPYYGAYTLKARTVVKGMSVTTDPLDIVLYDDYEGTLRFNIPKPKPEIASVSIEVITEPVVANQTFNMLVKAKLNMMTEESLSKSGSVTCVGKTTGYRVEKPFTLTFEPGDVEASTVVSMILEKVDVYTCKARVDTVSSPEVIVEVLSPTEAMIQQVPQYMQYIIYILVIAILIVAIYAIIVWIRRSRRAVHVTLRPY